MSRSAPFKLNLSGKISTAPAPPNAEIAQLFELKKAYDLSAKARGGGKIHTEELTDEIVQLTTEDGIVWYGYGDDLPDLMGGPILKHGTRRGKEVNSDVFTLPTTIIDARGGTRGARSFLKNMFIRIFKGVATPTPTELTSEALGRRIDERACSNPGLHRVAFDRSLSGATIDSIDVTRTALLFIHGTISSFEGGFSSMDEDGWKGLYEKYGHNIFAFNHRTLTESPIKNAIDILEVLPKGLELDLITHSRGGLIGDILVRCDARRLDERGYSAEEIDKVRHAKPGKGAKPEAFKALSEELETLNGLAKRSSLTIRRLVRVACPAHGTRLLSNRLDHFAQFLFNATKALAPPAAGVIELLETFVLAILKERNDPATFPGLLAMVPGSPLVAINNSADVKLFGTLISIAGDSEIGDGIGHSLKIIASNLYFTSANDLIVNTASMSRGITRRKGGNYSLIISSSKIDHFTYFKEKEYMSYVTQFLKVDIVSVGLVLDGGHELKDNLAETHGRGALVNKAYQPGELFPEKVSGKRPIIVLLPGIMGSNLYHNGGLQWVKLTALMGGALVDKLKYVESDDDRIVSADSAVNEFYGKLSDHLRNAGFDVSIFPYDWRRSLISEAEKLGAHLASLQKHQQPIKVVAHSMGGLLMRQFIFDNYPQWTQLRESHNSRIIFLGTPWRGSHLITQLLTGHLSRIRQLGLLDLHNSRERILQEIGKFPGVTQLLPLDDPRTFDFEVWCNLADASRDGTPVYSRKMLSDLINYKDGVEAGLKKLEDNNRIDYNSMIYVAGFHESTVDDFRFRYRRFFNQTKVEYIGTTRGDGSVTWDKGIPAGIAEANIYFTRTEHGLLAADPSLFSGLVDLLREGQTTDPAFDKTEPSVVVNRGGIAYAKTHILRKEPLSGLSPAEVLFGIKTPSGIKSTTVDSIDVKVFNGDLKWAMYPVMVGHFEGYSIISAERSLDIYLDNVLTERHQMEFYPSAIGEQELIVDSTKRPLGAVIVGLGQKEELTGYLLAKTVEKGLVKYALFRRDNDLEGGNEPSGGLGISMLIIGSNFGQLPLLESIRNLLLGVQQANETIATFNSRSSNPLKRIVDVELVDFYEDRAYEAYQIIQDISTRGDINGLNLSTKIESGFGSRKRFLREVSSSWWQPITTLVKTEKFEYEAEGGRDDKSEEEKVEKTYTHKYLAFDTYNRGASVRTDQVNTNYQLAKSIADKMSHIDAKEQSDAKVLFELLIPNRYKDFIRNHRNLLWRLDRESAAFPWELFSDDSTGDEPTFVRAGMIRQLRSKTSEFRAAPVREKRALIIADPVLGNAKEEYGQLDGACKEGKSVSSILQKQGDYKVVEAISKLGLEIIRDLVVQPYRVIHIAAHGVYSPLPGRTGIVIENGELITPGTLSQLPGTPELVFVNCCYLGVTAAPVENASRNRHRLAANIGTQLIESGVRAVIVAGWRVNDNAALLFAEVFYERLFAGETFGNSVLYARKRCWEAYGKQDNTWGAYQCYGDPFYRLDPERRADNTQNDISLSQEIKLEIDNLASQARNVIDPSGAELRRLQNQAYQILSRADELGIRNSAILEAEASFQSYLGNYEAAIDRYEQLFRDDTGRYELSSYFKYINLKVRNLTKEAIAGLIKKKQAYDEICELAARLTEQQISDEGGISFFSDQGSIYKRKAALSATSDDCKIALRVAADYYLKAGCNLGVDSPEAIYHVCSFISLKALCEPPVDAERMIKAQLERSPDEYFTRWSDERDYFNNERNSTYALLRGANLKLAKAIWEMIRSEGSVIDLNKTADLLISEHNSQRRRGYNIRDVKGQLEHYDILIEICKILSVPNSGAVKQLGRIRDSLNPAAAILFNTQKGYDNESAEVPEKLEALFIPKGAKITEVKGVSAQSNSQTRDSRIFRDDNDNQLIVSVEIDVSKISSVRGKKRPEKLSIQIPANAVAALTKVTIEAKGGKEEHFFAWIPTVRGASAKSRGASIQINQEEWLDIFISETSRGRGNGKIKAFFGKAKRVVVEFFRKTKNFVNKEVRNKYEYQVLHLDAHDRIVYENVDMSNAYLKATLMGTEPVERSLLMLHGMFNTAKGTFKDLLDVGGKANPKFAKLLTEHYGRRALVMNMPTIFHSFQQNVSNLPVNTIKAKKLDIMANSRGTNVARHLSTVLDANGGTQRGKVWLAGGPAFGTPLANSDHILTLVNRVTMMMEIAGKPLGPVVPIITWLLEKVSKTVLEGDGLLDMDPDLQNNESLEKLNKDWDFDDPNTHYTGSNFTPKKKLKRLIDAKLIDEVIMGGVDNDGVIPTQGTLGLDVGEKYNASDPLRYLVPKSKACGHFMYYQQEEVVKRLIKHLQDSGNPYI